MFFVKAAKQTKTHPFVFSPVEKIDMKTTPPMRHVPQIRSEVSLSQRQVNKLHYFALALEAISLSLHDKEVMKDDLAAPAKSLSLPL